MESAYVWPDCLCSVVKFKPRMLIMSANSLPGKTVNPAYSIQCWMRFDSVLKPNVSRGRVWTIRTALGNIPIKCCLPNKSTPPLQDSSKIFVLLGVSSALLPTCWISFLMSAEFSDSSWLDLVMDTLEESPQNCHSLVALCCGYTIFLFGGSY